MNFFSHISSLDDCLIRILRMFTGIWRVWFVQDISSCSNNIDCWCFIVLFFSLFYKIWLSYWNIRWHFLLSDELGEVNKVRREDFILSRFSLWNFSEFFLNVDGEMGESRKEHVGFLILEESNIFFILMKWEIVVITDLIHLLNEVKSEGLAKLFLFHLFMLILNFTLLIEE